MKRYLLGFLFLVGLSVTASAQCSPFPCIVATATLTGQSAPIGPTTVFTPSASGVFRVSTYLSASHPITRAGGTWSLSLEWTDDNGSRDATTTTQTNSSNASTATTVVQALEGQPVIYKISPGRGAQGTTYNLYLVMEQLE